MKRNTADHFTFFKITEVLRNNREHLNSLASIDDWTRFISGVVGKEVSTNAVAMALKATEIEVRYHRPKNSRGERTTANRKNLLVSIMYLYQHLGLQVTLE